MIVADFLVNRPLIWLACPLAALVMLVTRRFARQVAWACLVAAAPGYFFLWYAIRNEPTFWFSLRNAFGSEQTLLADGVLLVMIFLLLPSVAAAMLLTAGAAFALRMRTGAVGTRLPLVLCAVMTIALICQQLVGMMDIS